MKEGELREPQVTHVVNTCEGGCRGWMISIIKIRELGGSIIVLDAGVNWILTMDMLFEGFKLKDICKLQVMSQKRQALIDLLVLQQIWATVKSKKLNIHFPNQTKRLISAIQLV